VKRREIFASLAACTLTAATPSAAWGAPRSGSDISSQLFLAFAKSPGLSTDFIEEKHIALLKQPIINHGRLYFTRPALFARHIDKPFRSAIILKNHELTLWDKSGSKTVPLDHSPAVAALATSFLSLLQGNRKQLEPNYRIMFNGTFQAWNLELFPKQVELERMIRSLSFSGNELSITKMKLIEATGDMSQTYFANALPRRSFTEDEKQRYFSVPKG
jgi:outer membrane lipoprotein-sorting protein